MVAIVPVRSPHCAGRFVIFSRCGLVFFSRAAHVEICTGTALSINYYSMHIIGCRAGAWKTRKTFVSYKSCIFNSGRARPAPPPSRHLLNYLQNALFIVIAHCDLSMILSQKYANWFKKIINILPLLCFASFITEFNSCPRMVRVQIKKEIRNANQSARISS